MVCSLHSVTTGSRDRANVSLIIIIGIPIQIKKKITEEEAIPPPTKPGSVHRRVPADQAIPTQHLGAVSYSQCSHLNLSTNWKV